MNLQKQENNSKTFKEIHYFSQTETILEMTTAQKKH